jgi:hypothetical protein
MSGDYRVGYKNPPKDKQFQKGRSGNPTGRRKGSSSAKSDFERAMQRKVTLRIDDKPERITMQRAIFATLTHKAVKGDLKAFEAILKLWKEFPPLPAGPTAPGPDDGSPSPFVWTEEHESLRPFIEKLIYDDTQSIDSVRQDRSLPE